MAFAALRTIDERACKMPVRIGACLHHVIPQLLALHPVP